MTNKLIDRLEELADEMKLIVAQIRKPSTIVEEALTAATSAEDIIEFEGAQYKKVDREAREGDVVIFPKLHKSWNDDISENKPYRVSMLCGEAKFEDDAGDPMSVYGGYTGYDDVASVLVYELFGAKPQMEGERLVKQCEQHFPPVEKSPNEKRAEMIEKAKMFIQNAIERGRDGDAPDVDSGHEYYRKHYFDVDFHVKNNKVTTLVFLNNFKGERINNKPDLIGRAKCDPSDVFNKYIGKAIALGRALGLDVSEFEQAVQPTIAVGQYIQCLNTYDKKVVSGYESVEVVDFEHGEFPKFKDRSYATDYKIINDTNAIYGGGE